MSPEVSFTLVLVAYPYFLRGTGLVTADRNTAEPEQSFIGQNRECKRRFPGDDSSGGVVLWTASLSHVSVGVAGRTFVELSVFGRCGAYFTRSCRRLQLM